MVKRNNTINNIIKILCSLTISNLKFNIKDFKIIRLNLGLNLHLMLHSQNTQF